MITLTFGLVEFIKHMFSLEGKVVTAISAGTGVLLMGFYQLAEVLPEPYGTIFKIVYLSLAFGLSASGFYKYLGSRTAVQE